MSLANNITGDTRSLLKLTIIYGAAGVLAGKFINIFLIRAMDNIMLIIGKNMLFALATLIAFLLGTRLLSKISVTTVLRMGIGSILVYYLAILLLQNWLNFLIFPLGIINGFGTGFYFCAFNILLGRLASDENRGTFFGLQKVFSNLFGIFIPTLAGFIIISFTDFTGYYFLFVAAIFLLIYTIFLSFKITGFKSEKQLNPLPVLKVKGNKYWDANKLYSMSWGFSTNIFMQTFTLFAFAITASELRMGNYSSLMAIISLLSSLWVTKKINPSNRKKIHLLATVIHFLVLLNLGLFATEWTLLVAFIGVGIVQSWGMNISQSVKFQLSTLAQGDYTQEEFLVAAEFPLALGRILGQITALLITAIMPLEIAYRMLILICSVFWIIDHLIVKMKVNWFKISC